MLVATASLGKATGPVEGDSFDEFVVDLAPSQIDGFFASTNPAALATTYLGTATVRMIYDLDQVPACAVSIARETHVSALAPGQQTQVQLHFVYSDGFGRIAQTRSQAEPGPLDLSDPASPVQNPRWIASGATIYNNKGKPVRQFEPFFSATPQYGIETWGVSSTLFYDALERVVATLHPNNTFAKVVFDPWQQTTYDVNDTVTFDPTTDPDVGEFFSRLPATDYLPTWYNARINGALGPDEQAAAQKAAAHANTPTIVNADSLGRAFLTIVDNGKDASGNDQQFPTQTSLDIEGNPLQITDALGRVAMRYDYAMLGVRIHQLSMEAGERWTLNDVTGKPIRSWNSRGYAFRTEYDALRRPSQSFVQGGDPSDPSGETFPQEILFEERVYGDSPGTGLTETQEQQANVRGRLFRVSDGAGVLSTALYDFKGNSLTATRQFTADYKNAPDWSQNPALETQVFTNANQYDALNRAIVVTAPDGSVYVPTFNLTGLLETVAVNLQGTQQNGQPVWTEFVTNIDYDAKGQRTLIQYANGAVTNYGYDPQTFRLIQLTTTRAPGTNGLATQIFKNASVVQDLQHTYDPIGNITRIEDAAIQTVFNANQQVDPAADYTYDPLYRLTQAQGRENIGQSAFAFAPANGNYRDYPFVGAAQQSDLQALRNYIESYVYDPLGNFQSMAHQAAGGGWTRAYSYNEASLIEPAKMSNRLSQTALEASPVPPIEPYSYDAHGNVIQMPHLPVMLWNFKDELAATSQQVVTGGTPEATYYVYGTGGLRARKVTERQTGTAKEGRYYLGGFEDYREFDGTGTSVTLERQSLHVMDDKRRIALVETRTQGNDGSPAQLVRYQLADHLGSTSVELDDLGLMISYEEYYPYGGSSYQALQSGAAITPKRYRFSAKERDEETGFAYHQTRYYVPWLGRWSAVDPDLARFLDWSSFVYVFGNPLRFVDDTGRGPKDPVGLDKLLNKVDAYAKNTVNLAKNVDNFYIDAATDKYPSAKVARWEENIGDQFQALSQKVEALTKDLNDVKLALAPEQRAVVTSAISRLNAVAGQIKTSQERIARSIAPHSSAADVKPNEPPPPEPRGELPKATARYVKKKPASKGGAGAAAEETGETIGFFRKLFRWGWKGTKALGEVAFYAGAAITGVEITSDLYHGDYMGAEVDALDFGTMGGFSYGLGKLAETIQAGDEAAKAAGEIREFNRTGPVRPQDQPRETQEQKIERQEKEKSEVLSNPLNVLRF